MLLVPQHLGELHAWENALVALLAFGPFVVLVAVVVLRRRRDAGLGERRGAAGEEARGRSRRADPSRREPGQGPVRG